jgi:hypothetical protein
VGEKIRTQSFLERFARGCVTAPRFWLLATVVIALAHAVLIFTRPLPPLHDYPGHIARVYIMMYLDQSAFLREYYDYEWKFRHNIGSDLVIYALAHLMPIEVAGRTVVAAIPALTLLGVAWIRHKIHQRVDGLVLLAVPYAMGTWFGWGFINYCFSIALALIAFAAWLHVRAWTPTVRSALLLGFGFIVWLAHLTGWGILCVLVFSWEIASIEKLRDRHMGDLLGDFFHVILRCLPLAGPLLVMAASTGGGGLQVRLWSIAYKFFAPLDSLAFTWDRADKYCVVLLFLMAGAGLLFRLTRISVGLALAALSIFAAYLVSPTEMLGGGSVDIRMLTPLALIAVTALAWRPDARTRLQLVLIAAITLGAAVVAIGRFSYTAQALQRYDRELAYNLALIELLPRGARILVLVVDKFVSGRPPLIYLPSIAVIRRDAFSNVQWEAPGGHTLVLKHWHEGAPVMGGEGSIVGQDNDGRPTGELERYIANEPLHRFDYVWVVNAHRVPRPRSDRIELVGETERSALYRVLSVSTN